MKKFKLVIYNTNNGKKLLSITFYSFSLLQARTDCANMKEYLPFNKGVFVI